jgi:hypothetical protein
MKGFTHEAPPGTVGTWRQLMLMNATLTGVASREPERTADQSAGCPGCDAARACTDHAGVKILHRANLPKWLTGAMDRADRNSEGGQLPMLLLHEHGAHDMLVILRLSDFTVWHGGLEECGR